MPFIRISEDDPSSMSLSFGPSGKGGHSSFIRLFAVWTRYNPDRFDRLWEPPRFGCTRIRLRLRRFAPHLVACLRPAGFDVAVKWDGEVWDLLRSDDLAPERLSDGRWRCSLCLPPDVETFETIEHLWVAHPLVPRVDWLENKLMPAELLYLSRHRGATWAGFASRTEALPASTRYAVAEEIE